MKIVQNVSIINDASLNNLLSRKSRACAIHGSSTLRAEVCFDGVATFRGLGHGFEGTLSPPTFIRDDEVHGIGATGVLLALAAVAYSLFGLSDDFHGMVSGNESDTFGGKLRS